ncbi:MAG: hypothetical protein WCA27_26425 [Candidatus Sulfotelmatobacter sp.]
MTENMAHQIAWIMSALDLLLPSAAYMSGGVFSEKDGREVPDTIAVTLDFPTDIVVPWQSTFSNKHYELGDRILGPGVVPPPSSSSHDLLLFLVRFCGLM